ncbi:MAG: RNA polymerase sigma factor, partial [Gemmataceae bacterium]
MAGDVLRDMIARLRQADDASGGLSDAQLLERFIAGRDEAAFEVLVWRHGGLVLGTARHWLGHTADADDAFQATFLTLARKAHTVRHRTALAAWLHQVVLRIALRARKSRARRDSVERPLEGRDVAAPEAPADDVMAVLDAEVNRLPEKHRRAVVLCYLQGRSTADAARELGCPRGTVLSRLAAARGLLQRRLARRGVGPVALTSVVGVIVSADLVAAAVRAGLELPNVVSPQVLLMSNGVIHAMFWKKLGTIAATLVVLAVCGVGLGWPGRGEQCDPPPETPTKASKTEKARPSATEKARGAAES